MSVTPIAAGRTAARNPAHRPAELLRRAWALFTAWRDRRRAASHLRALSDSHLRDIGITRMEIERLVRGGGRRGRPGDWWS